MFFRFLFRALLFRKQRLLLSFSALAVAATLATVLFDIYGTVERRIREEFKSYGANLVAVAADGTSIPLNLAAAAEAAGAQAAPFLITSGRLNGKAIAVAGFFPGKTASLTSYWHVEGDRNIAGEECLAGETLAKAHRLTIGEVVFLEKAALEKAAFEKASCKLKGIVSTGASEDQELLVPFPAAERIAGVSGRASAIEIRVSGDRLDLIRKQLALAFPDADIRTVRSVAGTEASVVMKIRASLLLLTTLILAITTLCVSSNFSELVMERSKEIGILKALGAAERRIAAFFLSESAALAIGATAAGYGLGLLAASAIGREIFGSALRVQPDWTVFFSVAVVMLLVASLATAVAASRVWSIEPAATLRGE